MCEIKSYLQWEANAQADAIQQHKVGTMGISSQGAEFGRSRSYEAGPCQQVTNREHAGGCMATMLPEEPPEMQRPVCHLRNQPLICTDPSQPF